MGNDGPAAPPRYKLLRRLVRIGSWLSLAVVVIAWLLIRLGDSWAPATFLMFGPRWPFAVPPALLLVPAAIVARRTLVPIVIALVMALGPLMSFNVPWEQLGSAPEGQRLRVITCNMHYIRVEPGAVDRLVAEANSDVVALQECRVSNRISLTEPEWHVDRSGEFFLASRYPIRHAEMLGDNSDQEHAKVVRYELETPGGVVTLVSLHLASPRHELKQAAMVRGDGLDSLESNTELRSRQAAYILEQIAPVAEPIVLLGDFNTPPESVLMRDAWGNYRDAFAEAGWGWGHTFTNRWTRVRIDHVLVGNGCRATSCWVGPNVGSPHLPVIADVVCPPKPSGN